MHSSHEEEVAHRCKLVQEVVTWDANAMEGNRAIVNT